MGVVGLQFGHRRIIRAANVEMYKPMAADSPDARVLLQASPDDYVAERTRLVKEARADKNRSLASFYQSLKRPSLSLWAVLAAGEDADAVNDVVNVTSQLGETQAEGGTAGTLSAATKTRRKALEGLVDKAVAALGKESGAEARRPEIRSIIDQLSRHPELVDSWIDGTLRELPEDDFGFGAFADMQVPETADAAKPAKSKQSRHADAPVGRSEDAASKPRADAAARAARAEEARAARKDVSTAARELAVAERDVHAAETAVRRAEKDLKAAEDARATAEKRHQRATARLEASRSE
jgi:hypothetical protein